MGESSLRCRAQGGRARTGQDAARDVRSEQTARVPSER